MTRDAAPARVSSRVWARGARRSVRLGGSGAPWRLGRLWGPLSRSSPRIRPPPTRSVELGRASLGHSARGLPCPGSLPRHPLPRPPPFRCQIRAQLGFPAGGRGRRAGSLFRSRIENEEGWAPLPPVLPPLKRGPKYPTHGRHPAQNRYPSSKGTQYGRPSLPDARRTGTPSAPSLFVHIYLQRRVHTAGPAALGGTRASREGRRPLRGRLLLPPLLTPPSTPAARGAQVGTACECLQDERLCVTDVSVRGRVHARWARRLTLQSPEPAPRTRTGPLQLPRAMILWKQKLKVGRNNGGPIGCNLGQARTC